MIINDRFVGKGGRLLEAGAYQQDPTARQSVVDTARAGGRGRAVRIHSSRSPGGADLELRVSGLPQDGGGECVGARKSARATRISQRTLAEPGASPAAAGNSFRKCFCELEYERGLAMTTFV